MKNKKSINRENTRSGNAALSIRRGLWRTVSICLLFIAMVFASVFGVTGLFGSRHSMAGVSNVAYADAADDCNDYAQKWAATIAESVAETNPDLKQKTFQLEKGKDWIAQREFNVDEGGNSTTVNHTWFGKVNTTAFVNNVWALNVPANANIVLDLNGQKLDKFYSTDTEKGVLHSNGYVINVASGGKLTIMDSSASKPTPESSGKSSKDGKGLITGGWNSNGAGAIIIAENSTCIMESGTIAGNKQNSGGAVNINGTNGKFVMNGGIIKENYCVSNQIYNDYRGYNYAAGVVNPSAIFEMHYDSEISHNVGPVGGVGLYTGARFYMYDNAKIDSNEAYGLLVDQGTGVNTWTGYACVGGVFVAYRTNTFEMRDNATISNNKGTIGGLYSWSDHNSYRNNLYMYDNASIINNSSNTLKNVNNESAWYSTGGVFLHQHNRFYMNGSAVISNNTGRFGGLCMANSYNDTLMSNQSGVIGNTSDRCFDGNSTVGGVGNTNPVVTAGGVYIYANCALTMNDQSSVKDNKAGWSDWAAWEDSKGGENLPYGTGGVVVCGTLTMNEGTSITGNMGLGYKRGVGGIMPYEGSGSIKLLGAKVNDNWGYISGGICKIYNMSLSVGYAVQVKDNYVVEKPDKKTGKECNDIDLNYRRLYEYTKNGRRADPSSRNNVINIEAGLEDGARMGVIKYTSNYSTDVSSVFTSNYYKNNATESPSKFFYPSLDPDWEDEDKAKGLFEVTIRIPDSGYAEAGFVCKDDMTNWQYAIIYSTLTAPKTVKLEHDVTADASIINQAKRFYSAYNDDTGFSSGALHVPSGKSVILDLNGHTIDRALVADEIINGTGYVILNYGTLEITDTSSKPGSIKGGYNVTTTLSGLGGCILTGNVTYGSTAVLNITGGVIEDCYADNGAGVYLAYGKLKMSGGVIKDNNAQYSVGRETTTGMGGGIYSANPSEITVTGGTITGNSARYGGGIYMYNGWHTIGSDSGNVNQIKASVNQKLKIHGGTITKNTATVEGGGIGLSNINMYFGMKGAPVIKDNTVNGKAHDIYLQSVLLNGLVGYDNDFITIEGELTGKDKYGVYRNIGYTFTKNFSNFNKEKSPTDIFTAQKDGYYVQTDEDGKEGELISDHGGDNWYAAVVLSRIKGNKLYTVKLTEDWTAVRNTTSDFNTSLYGDRSKDVNVSGTGAYYYGALNVPASVSILLDLNGYTIDRGLTSGYAGTLYGSVIFINQGTLYIYDNATDEDGNLLETGKITGGWVQNPVDYYYGGGITLNHDASRLWMFGGNITENRGTSIWNNKARGVGGVSLATANAQFNMLGGSITKNVGSYAGGVAMASLKTGTFTVGGKPIIAENGLGNWSTAFGKGTPCDVHNNGNTAGTTLAHSQDINTYKIGVSKLEEGAHIGICRPDVNNVTFMETNGNVFTSGYSMYNNDEDGNIIDPSTYFFASNSSQSEVRTYTMMTGGEPSGYEATIWNVDASSNWSAAVGTERNVNASPILITLQGDWVADDQGRMGTGIGFTAQGSLTFDSGNNSNIILDLNGHTIDRGLTDNPIEGGFVINMFKSNAGHGCRLEITDSSENKTGKIIGGNNTTPGQAGGINVSYGNAYLTISGGTITGNIGDAGGVATYTDAAFNARNYFAMGGSALVTGNTNLSDEALNINLRGKYNQQIEIISELTAEEPSGITKDSSSDFTINFPAYHADSSPTDHFTNDSTDNYVIKASSGEGALYTMDNYSNWVFAINESVATRGQRTVMLVSDWIAPMTTGMFGKSADDTTAFFNGGALNVPANANIVLDLNGYTLNRNLRVATDYGFVINVENGGRLTIRDNYVPEEEDEDSKSTKAVTRVGTITGGNNRTTGADYVGGGINNRGFLYFEGGLITGNYTTADVTYSAGGIFTDNVANNALYMTGGTITGNFGAFTGGINVLSATNTFIGGSAVIRDNKLVGGKLMDVRPSGDAVGNRINVYSPFTKDADIRVSYVANNYSTNRNSRIFTSNFTTVNPGLDPATVFHYADPLMYEIIKYAPTEGSNAYEAAVWCIDNEQNWRQAIEASSATVRHTVTLSRDWTASNDNTYITSFGANANAYINGALYVPSSRSVELDLNGYTINRNLTAARTQGYVINLAGGNLIVSDSKGTGIITGGYSNDTAGGIHYASGSLTLTGGTIKNNTGVEGGVYIATTTAQPFSMGGSAVVSNNNDTRFNESNVVALSPVQMINIVSAMTAKTKTCFERPGVGEFTTNFIAQNRGKDPADFFTSVDPMYVFKSESGEGSIYTNDNSTNWEYAVKASVSGGKVPITFMLVDDWNAPSGKFGTDATAFTTDCAEGNGALFVPNTASIILDLNGHILNRNLPNAVSQGYVIRVYGDLRIVDNSKEGTGIITGGNNSYSTTSTYLNEPAMQSSAICLYSGPANNRANLTIEGGTISGNIGKGYYSSAVTLWQYNGNYPVLMQMTGGTITGNYGGCTTPGDRNGAGGILLMTPQILQLKGNPKIYDNWHNGGYECNVRLNAPTNYITVIGEFTNGAHIGVAPTAQVNNWTSAGGMGSQFTVNFGAHHKGVAKPSDYFFGSWVDAHDVRSYVATNGAEGTLYCLENYVNWVNAVNASANINSPQTFQLSSDWVAAPDNQFGSMFSPTDRSTGMNSHFNYGAIFLLPNKYIILDLNGHIIDRNLSSEYENGYAIYSRGRLEIIDSSKEKTGKIIGAYNKTANSGGGVITDGVSGGNNGLLTIRGGSITDNVAPLGAGVHVVATGKLQLGDTAQVYGNYSNSGEASNVYIASTAVGNITSLIEIVSEFKGTDREKIGVNRGSNGDVTRGFADKMPGDSPLDYFASENSKYYGIESGEGEFFFLSPNNDINWEYAVTQSMGNKPAQTVRLTEDWVAGPKGTDNDTAFYTAAPTSNGVWNGMLFVPNGASVILDLNGHKLDRHLIVAKQYGQVILVQGKLTIIDSSEEGTGEITGGHPDRAENPNSGGYKSIYAGGITVGGNGVARLDLLGGTIRDNQIDQAGYAGGVYVVRGCTFNIDGGTVTKNYSPTGGVVVADGAIMGAAGKSVIKGNGPLGADYTRDVIFNNYSAGVINVTGSFEDGAQIGVYKVVNNYDPLTLGGAKVTVDYSRYNNKPVDTYFFSSDENFYRITELTGTGSKEVGLFCHDNNLNWAYAVSYSNSATGEQTVTLYHDWEAKTVSNNAIPYFNYQSGDNGGMPTIYSGVVNGYANSTYYGALRVPGGKQIRLDLNGHKIDRKLTAAYDYGYVFYVDGSLHIVDTSKDGTGLITGGFIGGMNKEQSNIAAGVYVPGGTFKMEGGKISGNKGTGVFFTANSPFSLGGSAKITGNIFDKGTEANVHMENKDQKITIISKFEDGAEFGVTRGRNANAPLGAGTLTTNYSKYNKKEDPMTYFRSDSDDYNILSEGDFADESMEAVILGKNNRDNWYYAIQTSLNNGGRPQTFTMYEDWEAETDIAGCTTSFNGKEYNNTGYRNGALYVPYGANVVLDLNGWKLDRKLTNPQGNGEVIYVRGTLTIRDSSEKKTGTITGARTNDSCENFWTNIGYQYYQSYGAVSVYLGTLNMEGGTITGNKNYGTVAGGIYVGAGSTFNMTGGKITGNSCYNPNNGTTVRGIGGIYADGNASIRIGGDSYIYDNKYQDAAGSVLATTQSNVYLQSSTNLVYVNEHFVDGAKVGITVNSDQIAASGRFITSGWQTHNNDGVSTDTFVSDHEDQYMLNDYNQSNKHELIMFCRDNQINWMNTVQTSINTRTQQTFVLYDDWTADTVGAWYAATSFYAPNPNATGYYYGALYVPGNANIILDLHGNKLDRKLWGTATSYSSYGYVILVAGQLTIIDSTATQGRDGVITQGEITGGWCYDGGGIYSQYGKLDVQAGLIHDNAAARFGAGIFYYQSSLSIGGTIQFKDNVYSSAVNRPKEDIMFYYNNYMMNISTPMVIDSRPAYNKIAIRRDKIGTFTTNWGKNNPTIRPETVMTGAGTNTNYRVYSSGAGAQREGVILANNNNDNWIFAVTTSLSTKTYERFTLVDEGEKGGWTAAPGGNGYYTTTFGTHSQAYRNGALLVPAGANVVLDLNGLTLDRNHPDSLDANYATYNMVIIVEGNLQIIDTSDKGTGKITKGSYGIYVNNKNSTVTIGGMIAGDLEVTGDESAAYGSTFGGNITGNTKPGVYAAAGNVTVTGGNFVGNGEAGVYMTKNAGKISIAGNPVMYDKEHATNPGIYLEDKEKLINIVDELEDTARIGYKREGTGQLTKGWGEHQGNSADPFKNIFLSQDPGTFNPITDTFDDYTEISVSSYDSVVNWQSTVDRSISTGKQQEFTMYACWTAVENQSYTTAFGTTSAYKNGALFVPKGANVILNLNGHTLDRALESAAANGMVIYVDGQLTIRNKIVNDPNGLVVSCCKKDKGTITGGKNNTASSTAGLYVGKDGSVVFESGRLTNNIVSKNSASAASSAGAAYVVGKLEMIGGQIDNNEGTSAGAVYVASSGTFEMSAGSISANEGTISGAIYVTGTFNLSGGAIADNVGDSVGGVYVGSGGKFTMSQADAKVDSAIEGNRGSTGAVYVNNGLNTYFIMNGGYILENNGVTASAIYAAGKVELHGGTIKKNVSSGNAADKTEGGAIYITSTGNVTIKTEEGSTSVVDISENKGVNGIRVVASGVLGVGGDVRIQKNEATDKNLSKNDDIGDNPYNNIYFVTATRKLEVVSAFAADAKIGIYRPTTGIFTKGYGLYNSGKPDDYFTSDIELYKIAFNEQPNVLENEAAIGLVVDPEPTTPGDPVEYNGGWQVIISSIDTSMVVIDEDLLPDDVRISDNPDENGYYSIEAVNAGEYTITFTLKSGFCWSDGTTAENEVTGTIVAKQVEIVWDETKFAYDKSRHTPSAEVAASDLCENVLDGTTDDCGITVSGGEIASGKHTATATSDNPNYEITNPEFEYEIGKALRDRLVITTTEAGYRTPTEIKYINYEEDSTSKTFRIAEADQDKASFDENGKLIMLCKPDETIEITMTLGESDNYAATEVTAEITCIKASLSSDTKLDFDEMEYGETKALALKESYDDMLTEIGTISWSVENNFNGTSGQVLFDGSAKTITAQNIGEVRVIVTAGGDDNEYYNESTIYLVITIKPKLVTLDWDAVKSVEYNGTEQTVAVPVARDSDGNEVNNIVNVYKAGFAGWDTSKQKAAWTDAGKYDVGFVLGSNYCLAKSDDYFATFQITKAKPNAQFKDIETWYNIPFNVEVEYVDGFGSTDAKITIGVDKGNSTVGSAYSFNYDSTQNKCICTVMATGKIAFTATITATDNFEGVTINGEYTITEAIMKLGIEPQSADHKLYYGDENVQLIAYYLDGNGNPVTLKYKEEATITLADEYAEFATLTDIDDLERTVISVHKAGKIKITVESHIDTENFKRAKLDIEVELLPKEVTVSWTYDTEDETFVYDGNAQHPTAAPDLDGLLEKDKEAGLEISDYKAYIKDGDNFEEVENGAVHVGTYYIIPVFSNPNYAVSVVNSVEIEILPRPVMLNWVTETLQLTYNGKEQAPTAVVANNVNNDEITVTVLGTKEASDSELMAKAYALDNDDYTLEGVTDLTCGFWIDPLEIEIEWGNTDLTYNGLAQHPEYTIKGLLAGDECKAIIAGSAINSGTYTATVTGLNNPNYKAPAGAGVEFTITSAQLEITFKYTEVTYGTPVTLEVEGNDGNGRVIFTIKEGSEKATIGSGNWFTPIDIGEVTITASIAATDNYEEMSIDQVVTIVPRPIEVNWENLTFEYDGKVHSPTASVTNAINGDDLVLTISEGEKDADTYTAAVTAVMRPATEEGGEATVEPKYTVEGGLYIEQEYVITPRVLDISWTNTTLTYNGQEQAPTPVLNNLIVTKTNEEGEAIETEECSIDVAGAVDAGKRLKAVIDLESITNSNYTVDEDDLETWFTILPKLIKIEWGPTELTYNGQERVPTATAIGLEEGDECKIEVSGAQINVGPLDAEDPNYVEYKATATGVKNPNYTLVYDEEEVAEEDRPVTEIAFSIVRAKVELELSNAEVFYGDTLDLSISSNPGEADVSFVIKPNDEDTGSATIDKVEDEEGNVLSESRLSALKAGTVTVHVVLRETTNYEGAEGDFTVTIKKVAVEISWEYAEYTYNGKEQKPVPTVVNAIGDDEVNIDLNDVEGFIHAGEHVAKVLAISNDNYTLEDGINVTANYTILAKPITSITWEEDRVYPFNGDEQGPEATAGGLVEGDECEVIVSGKQVNVGNYTATISGLENTDYSLDLITDRTIDFEITVSEPVITFETTQVLLNKWEQIKINGNVGDGEVTFTLLEGEEYGELSGDMLYGKALGSVKIKVTVSATSNTEAAEAEGVISITKGSAPLKLETTTAMYGDKLALIPDDNYGALRDDDGNLLFGEVSYKIDNQYSTLAEIQEDDDGNKVLLAKGVGTLILRMKVGTSAYYEETEVFVTITIVQRIVKIKWVGNSFTYNGEEQAPEAIVSNLVNGDECTITVSKNINAGDYTAQALELSNENYTLERATNAEKAYTIEKAKLTLTWGDDVLKYTGSELIPTATLSGIIGEEVVNPVYKVKDDKESIIKGNYTVIVSELEGENAGNYMLAKNEYALDYEIVAADREPVLDPAEIAYGTTETLVVTDESLIENATYTLAVLKNESVGAGNLTQDAKGNYKFEATRVGKVKISVTIPETDNCNAYSGTVEITVVKAELETEIESLTGVYGEALELKLKGYSGDMSGVKFTLDKADKENAEIVWKAGEDDVERWYLVPKHAAEVSVSVTVPETTDFIDDVPTTATITIKQREANLVWDNTELTYNGEVQAPTATVDNIVAGDVCDVIVGTGKTDAGKNYIVYAESLSNEDYKFDDMTDYTSFNINKAPLTVDLKNTRVGSDAPTTLIVTGNDGNGKVTFTVDDESIATIEGDVLTPSKKGTVYVTIEVEETKNYLSFTSKPIMVVIDKSQLILTLDKDEVLYGDELTLTVSGNVEDSAVDFTVTNSSGEAEIKSGNILVAQKAGTVLVTATIAATETYALTIETFTVTITQRVVTIQWSTNNEFNYDGVNLWAPTARVVSGLINDDECDVIVSGAQLNVGKYAAGIATATGLSNTNYKVESNLRAPQFEIKKAALNIEFITTAVTIKVPTEIKISGNKEFGDTTFQLIENGTAEGLTVGQATLEGSTITGTELGFVHVTVTVAPTENYEGGFAEYDIEIQKPAAPVDLENKTVEYGQTLNIVIDKGLKDDGNGNMIDADEGGEYSISLVADKGTGSATLEGDVLTATGAGEVYILITVTETDTFRLTKKEIKVTITPIVIEVEWTYPELTYNGTMQTPTAIITNIINGDSYELKYNGSTDAGKNLLAEIVETGNANYTVEGADASTRYEILPRAVVLDWDDTEEYTYNGREQKPKATVSNLIEGDDAEVEVKGATNAGSQTATAVSIDNTNYTVEGGTNINHLFLISKMVVAVEWSDLELTYNGKVQVPEATASGAVAGDEVHAIVSGIGKYVGTYSASATGVDNSNYQLASITKTDYTIVPAKVTFSQLTLTKEYNGEDQSPDVAINKLDANDDVELRISGYTAKKEVGDYDFVMGLRGTCANCYELAEEDVNQTFSITAKSVKVTLTTKDINAEYTGSAITLSNWYDLSCDDFIGADAAMAVEDIFKIINIDLTYKFMFNGEEVESAGVRGTYTILAQQPTDFEFSGSDNYNVTEIIIVNEGTLTVAGGDSLKLADDTLMGFIFLETDEENHMYRRSYSEKGWVHGKDDTEFERVVLGNIAAKTSVGDFLNNLNATQLTKIRIYNGDDKLIYDCGHAAEGIDDADLYDKFSYSVATGWRVLYGTDEEMADVVYLSVLGDLNGDGLVDSGDVSVVGLACKNSATLDTEEKRLAALVGNFGYVDSSQIIEMNKIIDGSTVFEDYFC